jgi:hypothetical protein
MDLSAEPGYGNECGEQADPNRSADLHGSSNLCAISALHWRDIGRKFEPTSRRDRVEMAAFPIDLHQTQSIGRDECRAELPRAIVVSAQSQHAV